jgi:hypothetical protein
MKTIRKTVLKKLTVFIILGKALLPLHGSARNFAFMNRGSAASSGPV